MDYKPHLHLHFIRHSIHITTKQHKAKHLHNIYIYVRFLSALPGAAADLRDEWLPFTTLLAKDMNCVCVLVYLDSMARPWVTKDILEILTTQVLHNTLHAEKAIILGKSYGGLLAHEFALKYPTQVMSLVLFAPASGNHERIGQLCQHTPSIPLYLGWTRDDPSYLHHAKFIHICKQKDFTFQDELYGGHAITQEYFEGIMKFLTASTTNKSK